jgi:hypothetical protein
LYPSAFRLRRCTTLLTLSSAGQLGRKLREWGVYKYDSKNRPSDTKLRLYHNGMNGGFNQLFPQAVPEDLSIPKDLPVHVTFTPGQFTAHTELLQDTNIEHFVGYAGMEKTLPDHGEAHGTFDELPEPPASAEYGDADITNTAVHVHSPAAIAASNNPTASMDTSQHDKAHEDDATSSVPAIAVVTEEPEHGRLSDIDMDRFSSLSFTPSVSSGFASLRSLAQRILLRQGEESSLRSDSLDDPPSSVMDWNRSNSSLQLFGRRSFGSSIASSQMTNSSLMSYTTLSSGSQHRYAPTEKEIEDLDPRYVKRSDAKKFFVVGRVFALLWHENARESRIINLTTEGKFGSRVAVVMERKGYCVCIPIHTYGGQGILKRGLNLKERQAHSIIYARGTKPVARKEELDVLIKEPIAVTMANNEQKLDRFSRINFAKPHTVEWNIKVVNIGKVAVESLLAFKSYFRTESF